MNISNPVKFPSKSTDFEILGKNQSGIYVHYMGNQEDFLELFNDQLRSVTRRPIVFKEKDYRIVDVLLADNGGYVFYSKNIAGVQYFEAKRFAGNLDFSATSISLDSLMKNRSGGFEPFYVKQSPNRQYYTIFSIYGGVNNFTVKYQIFDDSLRSIGYGTFDNNRPNIVLKSLKINNNGVVCAVMVKQRMKVDKNSYPYDEVYTYLHDVTTQKQSQQISKEEGFLFKNVIMDIDNKTNKAYTVVNYVNTNNEDDIGFILFSSDLDPRLNRQLRYAYTQEAVNSMHSFETKDWRNKAMLITPKEVIPQSDGGCLVITEGHYSITKVVRSDDYMYPYSYYYGYYNTPTRVYDQDHYFDINAISLSNNGNINWNVILPKMQLTEGDGGFYSSFATFESNNLLKFLFNEDVYSNGNFIEYNLNPAGSSKRLSILNTEKDRLALIPQKGIQLSATEMIIPSEQKHNLQLLKLNY